MKLFLFTCLFGLLVAIAGEPASAQNYTLSPNLSGQGTVTSTDGSINCTRNASGLTGTCSANYPSGTTVTMNATAAAGWTFSTWSSATQSGCMAGNPCVVTMTQNLSPTATFVQTTYTLSPILSGQGTVTSVDGKINCTRNSSGLTGTCSATYASGTTVTMNATAAVGWTFSTWSSATQSGCMAGNPCTVTMNQSLSPTATFVVSGPSYTLSPNLVGQGTVTSTDGKINCTRNSSGLTGTCSATYASGTTVTMNATAASGWTFQGWSGFCSGGNPCVLVMNQNLSPTATFTGGYTLSPILSGQGTVTSTDGNIDCTRNATGLTGTCSATYANGATVTMNATAASGWIFSAWSSYADSTCNGGNPCVVTMNQNLSPTATFAQIAIGIKNTITAQDLTATSSSTCPNGTSGSSCFSIQQNFYISVPADPNVPAYLAQNVFWVGQTSSGGWQVKHAYEVWTTDTTGLTTTMIACDGVPYDSKKDGWVCEGDNTLFGWKAWAQNLVGSPSLELTSTMSAQSISFAASVGESGFTTVPVSLPAGSSIMAAATPGEASSWNSLWEPQLMVVGWANGAEANFCSTNGCSTMGTVSAQFQFAPPSWQPAGTQYANAGVYATQDNCSSTAETSSSLYWSAPVAGGTATYTSTNESGYFEAEGIVFVPPSGASALAACQ